MSTPNTPKKKPKPAAKGAVAKKSSRATEQAGASARAKRALDVRVADAQFVRAATSPDDLAAPTIAEVAFAGRSNVGKSSLLNALLQRRALARTSSTPGRTRQINVFDVRLVNGFAVQFVDLPGYGYAKVAKSERASWGPLMEGYLTTRPTLRAVALLVDIRRGVEEDDLELIDFLKSARHAQENMPLEIIVVATKLDKLSSANQKPALMALKKQTGLAIVGFSAVTGDGREALWGRIFHACLGAVPDETPRPSAPDVDASDALDGGEDATRS
jgi:GTP-binding protein